MSAGATSQKARSQSKAARGSASNGLKEIHIDEEVKIAVNLSVERFHYSDQKGMNCSYDFIKLLSNFNQLLYVLHIRYCHPYYYPRLRLSLMGCVNMYPSLTKQSWNFLLP